MIVRPVLVAAQRRDRLDRRRPRHVFGQAIVMQLALAIVPGATSPPSGPRCRGLDRRRLRDPAGLDPQRRHRRDVRRAPAPDQAEHVAGPRGGRCCLRPARRCLLPRGAVGAQSGSMPTLRRWVDAGSHALHEWTGPDAVHDAGQPAGDPAGHGRGVPAFRWYDRELGRVLVANRPDDAAIIESRASTGRGLLADDGVSISNLSPATPPTPR